MRYNPHIKTLKTIMLIRFIFLSFILLVAATGCSSRDGGFKLPGIYRPDILQGNVIEQEMIDKLKPGMDKNQVHFIMGTPALIDPFHPERWEYIYTFAKGGANRQQLHVTIFFKDGKLAYLDGDVVSTIRKPPENVNRKSKTVDVPQDTKKKGFFGKILSALPFVGEHATPQTEIEDTEQTETTQSPIAEDKEEEDVIAH